VAGIDHVAPTGPTARPSPSRPCRRSVTVRAARRLRPRTAARAPERHRRRGRRLAPDGRPGSRAL